MIENKDELTARLAGRARNLYLTRQLLCSEAVLAVLNRGLGGGLTDDTAVRLAAGLPMGLGESGCTCGALTGGVLALGLFLPNASPGVRDRKRTRDAAQELHDRFKDRFRSTCCRVLSKPVRHDPKLHFRQCADVTGAATEMAGEIILERRPDLLAQADWDYLNREDTLIGAGLRRLVGL